MSNYRWRPGAALITKNDDTVAISSSEYRVLVEGAERGRIMAEGILSAMTYDGVTRYGREVSISADTVLAVFRAICPEDYCFWLEDQKKLAEEARKEAAENDIL